MKRKTKLLATFAVLVILIGGLYMFTDWFSKITGYFAGEDEKTRLAQCLDGKNVEFYTTTYCADCEKQKELFKSAFKFVNQVECGRDISLCPGVKTLPAWYINKTVEYGFKNLTELQQLSGCIDE